MAFVFTWRVIPFGRRVGPRQLDSLAFLATLKDKQVISLRRFTRSVSCGPAFSGNGRDDAGSSSGHEGSEGQQQRGRTLAAAAAALVGSLGVVFSVKHYTECKGQKSLTEGIGSVRISDTIQEGLKETGERDPLEKYGRHLEGLPTYQRTQIESHNSLDHGIWVTYKHGVYDITDFIKQHPGGHKLLLAAGKQLEPFFQLYAFHQSEMVLDLMEEYRIGNLDARDVAKKAADTHSTGNDAFSNDPKRHLVLQVNSDKPFNAETPIELLVQDYLTPNDIFFIRNHLPVPTLDVENYDLEVKGDGIEKPMSLSLAELRKWFPTHTVIATIQCTGNRRKDMSQTKVVRGLTWGAGAIGTAEWRGVKLSDVLAACGAREEDVEHVIFQGQDVDEEGVPYEASIPAAIAFNPRHEVLLAFQMNGNDLPRDHGYPLRVIAPGVAGVRQVKWLRKIILSSSESEGHFQKKDYRTFNPSIDWSNVDFSKVPAIQEVPVQSAICVPEDGTVIDEDVITIKGYAWSGGGRGIIRVDVSFDGGKTWMDAELHRSPQKLYRQWAWTLFEATYEIPMTQEGPVEIVCKAVDSAHNTQPETSGGIWNIRGLLNNSWYRIKVKIHRE